jgi:hypothetical protein
MRGARGWAAVAAAAVVLLTGGCSAKKDVQGAVPPPRVTFATGPPAAVATSPAATTTPPTPATSTTNTPAARSAPITSPDAAGGLAYVRAYHQEALRAFRTGDVTALVTYSKPTCNCRRQPANIQQRHAEGLRLLDPAYTFHELRVTRSAPNYLEIVARTELRPSRQQDSAGRVTTTAPERSDILFILNWQDSRWIIDSTSGTTRQAGS